MKIQIQGNNISEVKTRGGVEFLPLGKGVEVLELTDEEYKAKIEELKPKPTYIELRIAEYGTVEEQLEDIVENGLVERKAKVAAIKAKYPKTEEAG